MSDDGRPADNADTESSSDAGAPMSGPPVHVSTDEVHAHPHKTGHGRLDLIIALSAIFISAVSLVVAVEHGRTERDLVAANSWPFVQQIISNEYGDRKDIAIGVSNDGVGPAKIKSVEVFYNGQPVRSSLDLLHRCCGYDPAKPFRSQFPDDIETSLVDETALRAGEENPILKVHRSSAAPEIPMRFATSLLKLGFKTCYCSVLDECWTSDMRTTHVTPVAECPMPTHPFQPNGR